MRIAHIAPVIYPVPPQTYGGTERVIADLARAQAAAGHEVTVFGPSDGGLEGVRFIGEYLSVSQRQQEVEAPLPPGFPAELEAQQLRDLLRDGSGFDVLHLHGSAHASGVCAALGPAVFRTIHWRADEADHAEHFLAFPGERVIAISQRQARDVPADSLAGVVHHGIPADLYKAGDGAGEYLAFIGRMTDQKRPDRAIALADRLGMKLKLAGPIDPGNPDYFRSVVEPALGGDIEYVGSLDDREKQTFFANAAALVFPIDWPEPFGLVMIEAMACGTPVIGWNRGSVGEIVEDGQTGIVVSSLDKATDRFAEVAALDRANIRQSFKRRFTDTRMASETVALYRQALTQRSSSEPSASSPSP